MLTGVPGCAGAGRHCIRLLLLVHPDRDHGAHPALSLDAGSLQAGGLQHAAGREAPSAIPCAQPCCLHATLQLMWHCWLVLQQDTIAQPNENAKMKRATALGIGTTTFFYACIGIFGARAHLAYRWSFPARSMLPLNATMAPVMCIQRLRHKNLACVQGTRPLATPPRETSSPGLASTTHTGSWTSPTQPSMRISWAPTKCALPLLSAF